MPKRLEILPQHSSYSAGKLSHQLARQQDGNRKLRKQITVLKKMVRGEYNRGFCAGSADALGHVFESLPDFDTVVYVADRLSKAGRRKPPYRVTDEIRRTIEQHIAAQCEAKGFAPNPDFKMEPGFFLERAKIGVADAPSV